MSTNEKEPQLIKEEEIQRTAEELDKSSDEDFPHYRICPKCGEGVVNSRTCPNPNCPTNQ